MRLEFLLFDALLLGPPLVAGLGASAPGPERARLARVLGIAGSLAAPLMLGWMLVRSDQLGFDPTRMLGPRLLGLPLEAWLLGLGLPFVWLVCWSLGFARPAPDEPSERPLVTRGRFWGFLALIGFLTLVFEGWLLTRGVVLQPVASAGPRLIGVPLVDIGVVVALAGAAAIVFERLGPPATIEASARKGFVGRSGPKGFIARWIERRFGGYRHAFNSIDEQRPLALHAPRRVAVIGGGLAGIGAAAKLAERGFSVALFEKEDYLGGKLGGWPTTMPDGTRVGMTHGFHAFFHHYYNLNEFFSQLGIDRHYHSIGDYMILTWDGRSYSFKDVATTPLLNLLSLARHGVYDLWEVAGRHTGPKMEALLRYDPEQTYADWDQVSYDQFAKDARLPASLGLVFNTFARAFFADPSKMSMAELIKSFHFYYLSNDAGLIYEHLDDDYEPILLAPLRDYMQRHAVELRLATPVERVACTREGERTRFEIDGETFDYLVIASDVVGTRKLLERSPELAAAAPRTAEQIATLRPGQRYAVLRIWIDRDTPRELPGFLITERERVLDALALVHRIERESSEWVTKHKAAGAEAAGVFELHSYALPDDLPDDHAEIRRLLLAEFHHFFPELADARIVHETMHVRRDFPAFHVGMHATRPTWDTELPELFLAGDWVRLPFPAMLMEAAYTSGLLAANAIFRREGLREEPVWTVPQRGFMAGWRRRRG